MSEYWKSVPRKFCDFCKCWITDNKPSVEFHERGKRHQENVELRLKEVRKKSLQNSLQEAEMKADMDKMEQAALEAFRKDLKENPELAAKYGFSLEPKPGTKTEGDNPSSGADNPTMGDNVKEWFEAVTPEGFHYYWSIVTGESKWDPPENFLSLQEQEANQTKVESDSGTSKQDSSQSDTTGKDHTERVLATRSDPRNSRSAYGTWDVVKEIEKPMVYDETSAPPALDDIPLPTDSTGKETKPKLQKTKFVEKIVTSLGSSGGAATFKKRKIASGARNVRQKDNND